MGSDILKAAGMTLVIAVIVGIILGVTEAVRWLTGGSLWGLAAYLGVVGFAGSLACLRAGRRL